MTIPFNQLPQLPVTVDLSLRDKNIFDSWKKTFIYVRNFGAKTEDFHLDFSKLTFQEKYHALNEFAFGEIEFRCKELERTWACLICKHFAKASNMQSILDEHETSTILKENHDQIQIIATFCKSSLWWAADLAAKQSGKQLNKKLFDCDSNLKISTNLWNLFFDFAADLDFLAFESTLCCTSFQQFCRISKPPIQLLSGPSSIIRFGSRTQQWTIFEQLMSKLNY